MSRRFRSRTTSPEILFSQVNTIFLSCRPTLSFSGRPKHPLPRVTLPPNFQAGFPAFPLFSREQPRPCCRRQTPLFLYLLLARLHSFRHGSGWQRLLSSVLCSGRGCQECGHAGGRGGGENNIRTQGQGERGRRVGSLSTRYLVSP